MTMFGVAALIGADRRPDAGRLARGQLRLALDLLHQRPGGPAGPGCCYFLVEDPDYLKQERAELRRQPLNFDYIGLGLLALVMSCWEVMLSKGQEWDWLGDPFWRVQTLMIAVRAGAGFLIFREMRIANPIVNFRVLGERNFGGLLRHHLLRLRRAVRRQHFAAGPAPVAVRLRRLSSRGWCCRPSGIFSIMMLVVVGFLLGRGVDARWLIAAGLLVMAAGNYWMAHMNLQISPWQVVWPRVVLTAGLWMIFAPINVAAFKYTPATSARGGGRPARPAPQRGGQRRHVDGPDHPGTPRTVPHVARGRVPRSLQPDREFLPGAGPRRSSSSRPATRPGRSRWPCKRWRTSGSSRRRRWPTSTSSGCVGRPGGGARVPGAAHEALGGREGGAHRGGIDPTERASWTV